jgi:LPXTG-motif cell wall-anchored protein
MFKKTMTLIAGISIVALGATSANAQYINDVSWDVSPNSLGEVEDYSSAASDAYGLDDSYFSLSGHGLNSFDYFDCGEAGDTETVELDGDFLTTCDDFSASNVTGIEWNGHVKVFDGVYFGIVARQVITLKNTTSSDITVDYAYSIDTEEADDRGTTGTEDGDLILEDGETWWAGDNDNDALEGIAFGTDGYARCDVGSDEGYGYDEADAICDEAGSDDFYVWNDAGVTIPAGTSINFVYFYSSVGAADDGSTGADALTDADFNTAMSFMFAVPSTLLADTRLFEGIIGGAYNWGTVPENNLADTGVDTSGIALGGALALVAGAGVYAVRRRRALA